MPSSQKLILVRHSHVVQQTDRPAREWELSENGRTRCLDLLPHLRRYAPARIITSEETKALQTGQIIAGGLGIPVISAPNLHEHDRRGVPYYEKRADFIAAVSTFFQHPHELVFGQETAAAAGKRFETAVAAVMDQYPNDTIAVVAHGTVITLYITHFNHDIQPISFWQTVTLPALYILDWSTKQLQHIHLHIPER